MGVSRGVYSRNGGGVSCMVVRALADVYLRGGTGGEFSSKLTSHFGASYAEGTRWRQPQQTVTNWIHLDLTGSLPEFKSGLELPLSGLIILPTEAPLGRAKVP